MNTQPQFGVVLFDGAVEQREAFSQAGFRCVCTTQTDRWTLTRPHWTCGIVDALGSTVEQDAVFLVVRSPEPAAFVAARLLLRTLPKDKVVLIAVGCASPQQAIERGVVDELESEVRLVVHCTERSGTPIAECAAVARALARPAVVTRVLAAGDRAAQDLASTVSTAAADAAYDPNYYESLGENDRDDGDDVADDDWDAPDLGVEIGVRADAAHGPCHAFVTHHPAEEAQGAGHWSSLWTRVPIGSCVSTVLHITGPKPRGVLRGLDELKALEPAGVLRTIEHELDADAESPEVVGFWFAGARASVTPRNRAEGLDSVTLWREFGARTAPLFPGEPIVLPAHTPVLFPEERPHAPTRASAPMFTGTVRWRALASCRRASPNAVPVAHECLDGVSLIVDRCPDSDAYRACTGVEDDADDAAACLDGEPSVHAPGKHSR